MFNGSINFTGKKTILMKSLFKNIKNNFTYELWVKPEAQIRHIPIIGGVGQKYVIGPGHPGMEQIDEAGFGLSIGTNGIAVFEHGYKYFPNTLTYETEINDWVHIALVFKEKTPFLFVNGQFIKKGEQSKKESVFASGRIGGLVSTCYFEGKVNHLRLWDHPRVETEITENMKKALFGNEQGLIMHKLYNSQTMNKTVPIEEEKENKFLDQQILNHFCLEVFDQANYLKENSNLKDVVVDVIIPIYNGYNFTKKCIESIFKNEDISFNLFLINDASSDKRIYSFLESLKSLKKPNHLKKLMIIHNDHNIGYVQSINKGLLLSSNHPILINSDTEIPPHCFRRLILPILENDNVASVTPFSNSAEICSFPNFVTDNNLPYNMSVNEIDACFTKYSINRGIVIPTGVGFCMALNRNAINTIGIYDDETFGKGYGEENDWCMKAKKKDYEHILIPNLFVYHKHGASFNQWNDHNKQQMVLRNLQILNKRYPGYDHSIQKFISLDPIKNIRDYMKSILVAEKYSNKKGILLIDHGWSGGTTVFLENYIKNLEKDHRIYKLEPSKYHMILTDLNHDKQFNFQLPINKINHENFKKLLNTFNVELIFINHLNQFPIDKMFNIIKNSDIDYHYFVHDFYCVCPSFNLINHEKEYCNAETNLSICQECIAKVFPNKELSMKKWREDFQQFLKGAKKIFTPSENTKDIILKYYKDLKIDIMEHTIDQKVTYTFNEEFIQNDHLNIAFIGAIGPEKGSKIIYELKDLIIKEDLPINIKVIGITNIHWKSYKSHDGKFEVTGNYEVSQLSNLLEKNEVALIINSSICPETYSYTTTEGMISGYPIMTFDIGAPRDRVKKYDGGWIINHISSDEVLKELKRLLKNRNDIKEKANNLKRLQKKDG